MSSLLAGLMSAARQPWTESWPSWLLLPGTFLAGVCFSLLALLLSMPLVSDPSYRDTVSLIFSIASQTSSSLVIAAVVYFLASSYFMPAVSRLGAPCTATTPVSSPPVAGLLDSPGGSQAMSPSSGSSSSSGSVDLPAGGPVATAAEPLPSINDHDAWRRDPADPITRIRPLFVPLSETFDLSEALGSKDPGLPAPLPAVDARVADMLESSYNGRRELLALISKAKEGWITILETSNLRVLRRIPSATDNAKNSQCYRVDALLSNTTLTCFDYMTDTSRRADWDDMCQTSRVVETPGPGLTVAQAVTRPVMLTSSREAVLLTWSSRTNACFESPFGDPLLGPSDAPEVMVNVTQSIDHPACPPAPGVIRLQAGVAGLVARDYPSRPGWCETVQILGGDPGGSVPVFVLQFVATKAMPRMMRRLSECVNRQSNIETQALAYRQQVLAAAAQQRSLRSADTSGLSSSTSSASTYTAPSLSGLLTQSGLQSTDPSSSLLVDMLTSNSGGGGMSSSSSSAPMGTAFGAAAGGRYLSSEGGPHHRGGPGVGGGSALVPPGGGLAPGQGVFVSSKAGSAGAAGAAGGVNAGSGSIAPFAVNPNLPFSRDTAFSAGPVNSLSSVRRALVFAQPFAIAVIYVISVLRAVSLLKRLLATRGLTPALVARFIEPLLSAVRNIGAALTPSSRLRLRGG
ncbi:hypothetical protein H696_05623 [Fonticula alba]|uniref:START domain-containing protein n=1 Tax=Fonticula alba TaxID=691883 RepID=A0A058Z0V9_FONAL|nr:hypothetical protein H696_05623 [Fonticula alba]KCV67894.1 hypothetical protein H696_05623 [Fonticula alba]|eukprot:XP_009497714.1 hypothetical protein H696_05623 [Fonticula alba]